MFIVFILLSFLLGTILYLIAKRSDSVVVVSYKTVFTIIMTGIYIVSFVSIVLLEFGIFRIDYLLAIIIIMFILALMVFFFSKPIPKIKPVFHIEAVHIIMFIILFLAAFLRLPPSNYVMGGQDQGLYVNIGNNIANTGKIFIKDTLFDALSGNPELKDYYIKSNYMWTGKAIEDKYEGTFVPGIYVKDIDKGELVPQFYHLQPAWFAISNKLLGVERSTYPLFIFSMLSIIAIYLLSYSIFHNRLISVISALLLAVNPLHSFMSRFPVTEVTASMFFLSALYFYLESENKNIYLLILSMLSFGCLFFTRITGFLFLPVLFFFLLYFQVFERSSAKRRNVLFFMTGIFVLYLFSLYHGLVFSFPYSHDIYKNNMGFENLNLLGKPELKAIVCGVLIMMFLYLLYFIVGRFRNEFRKFWYHMAKNKILIVSSILVVILLMIGHKAYKLGFTNKLVGDPWIGERWKMAGQGIKSLRNYFNLVVLSKFLTPLGILFFFSGIYMLLKKSFYNKSFLILGLFTINFFLINTVGNYTTPYLYYYARYLLSELLPLMIITISFALVYFLNLSNRVRVKRTVFFIIMLVLLAPPIFYSSLQAKGTELKGFYEGFKQIDDELKGKPILFIDSNSSYTGQIKPNSKDWILGKLITPLRFTFSRETFIFDSKELNKEKLRELFTFFKKQGYDVFSISNNTEVKYEYLKHIKDVAIAFEQMEISSSRPKKYNNRELHVSIYRYVE